MKKTLFNVTLAMAVFGMTFTACKKDTETQPQTEEVAVEENNSNLSDSEDITFVADSALIDADDYNQPRRAAAGRIAPTRFNGATLTFTPKGDNATGKVEIDFGTGIVWNGKTHKGKIIVAYTDSRWVSGAVRTITFDNYYINDNKIEGTKIVTFNRAAVENVFSASIDSEIKIKTKAGKNIEWNSTRTRVYDTKGTLAWEDDEVILTGSASGLNRNGETYIALITTPLTFKLSCVKTSGWFPSSGVLEVSSEKGISEKGMKRTVNYGSGSCDRTVMVTVGDKTFEWTAK